MKPIPNLESILNDCIHCGLCLPTCPTYRETGLEAESPRGRIMMMDVALKGELKSQDSFKTLGYRIPAEGTNIPASKSGSKVNPEIVPRSPVSFAWGEASLPAA